MLAQALSGGWHILFTFTRYDKIDVNEVAQLSVLHAELMRENGVVMVL